MDEFRKERIIEDLGIKEPLSILEVHFGDNILLQPGTELAPIQVKDPPRCCWKSEPNKLYTLVMIDPDAPSRENPKFREWVHWCVGNVPDSDLSKGTLISEYVGAGPPKSSGLHRYIILLFKQVGLINFNEPRLHKYSGEGRKNYSVAQFVRKYKFGQPIAANFFMAEWDEYVPELYKQLSGKQPTP